MNKSIENIKEICNQYYNELYDYKYEKDAYNIEKFDHYFEKYFENQDDYLFSELLNHLKSLDSLELVKFKCILYYYSFSSSINKYIQDTPDHSFAVCLDELFQSHSYILKEPLVVFRGLSSFKEYETLYKNKINTFISTTTNLSVAIDFSSYTIHNKNTDNSYEDCAILMITLPKDTKILFLPQEKEIILERNKYTIENIKYLGKINDTNTNRQSNLYIADIKYL